MTALAAGQSAADGDAWVWGKFSFSERFRLETSDNTAGLSAANGAAADYTRIRTCVGFQYFPGQKWEGMIKFTNEFRHYFVPETTPFKLDEVIFDQLYVKAKEAFDLPLAITVGRQNLSLGEGFVIWEGDPLDGSRSMYFNAVRADYALSPNHSLTIFYAYQPPTDNLLPIINDQKKALNDQIEVGMGAYYTGIFDSLNLQGYIIRKENHATSAKRGSIIHTVGLRLHRPLMPHLSATAEIAYQSGTTSINDRRAGGGYGYVEYKTGLTKWYPQTLTIGSLYLDGDNPATVTNEGWEPLFGRWPKWSDSYVYLLVKETGIAYWTNLASIFGRLGFQITPTVKLGVDYHHLMAPHSPAALTSLYGNGRTRGDLVISKVSYQLSKAVSGHLLWEYFKPGNYYAAKADSYDWFRMEFLLNY